MSNIDKQRIAAVRKLEQLGYMFAAGDWMHPTYDTAPSAAGANTWRKGLAMPNEQLVRVMARMDSHFAADDASPADRNDWKTPKRYIVRMMDGLALVETTLRMERELGRPFTEEMT